MTSEENHEILLMSSPISDRSSAAAGAPCQSFGCFYQFPISLSLFFSISILSHISSCLCQVIRSSYVCGVFSSAVLLIRTIKVS